MFPLDTHPLPVPPVPLPSASAPGALRPECVTDEPPPGPPPDGSGPGRAGARQPEPPGLLDADWAATSQVTRLLCATAHLQGDYAEEVIGQLLDPSFTAIAPAWGLDPVALAMHAKDSQARRRHRDRNLRHCLATMVATPLLVLSLYVGQALSPFSAALAIMAASLGGLIAAWMIVFGHYEQVRISALESMDARMPPRQTAPQLDAGTMERLQQLAEGNVVVFGGYQPFIGCGVPLDSWTICIDVEPAPGPAGSPGRIVPFDALDLHRHLLRVIPPQTPGDLWASSRLFVNGSAAGSVPDLVPAPSEPDTWPATRLPDEVLDRYTRKPSQAARTYVCLVQPAWGGELVVSTLTRAELAGGKLFVEGRTHALLPPKATFREVKWVPKQPRRAWIAVARAALPVTVPLLLGSFQRKLDLMKGTRRFLRNRERMRRKLREGHPLNYGASSTLREDCAAAGELKYYATVDEVRSFMTLKRQILVAVDRFLGMHGLATDEFRRQSEATLHETTVHLHDLAASADSFGPRNTVTVGTGITHG
ncbi:MAG TPA: hypothetical protein VFP72_04385 [Kineosporiaceae bacterium]|nr:hypothetical protein [Kineosporiaceae bacterium]